MLLFMDYSHDELSAAQTKVLILLAPIIMPVLQ